MNRFTSLLLSLDGSPESAKGIGCGLWLAEKLGATLHVLHATEQPLPGNRALSRLRVPEACQKRVVIHQPAGNAETAVLKIIEEHRIELVVMSARGESAPGGSREPGLVARAIVEQSPVPVLLLPAHYREMLPWTSMLAAVSGEAAANRALGTATRLAAALHLEVVVVHAVSEQAKTGNTPISVYADAPHHEYSEHLKGIIEHGLVAGCTEEEIHSCVQKILLRPGETATVLLDQASHLRSSMLAIGWHGSLGAGRSPVLKRLLEKAECPLLLVRESEHSGAWLKVGTKISGDRVLF